MAIPGSAGVWTRGTGRLVEWHHHRVRAVFRWGRAAVMGGGTIQLLARAGLKKP